MLLRASKLQPHLNAFVLIDAESARARGQSVGGALEGRGAAVAARRRADHDQDTTAVKGWPTR